MREVENADSASPAPVSKILFSGMIRPQEFMRVDESSRSGVRYFYSAYGLFCALPILLISFAAILAEQIWPNAWDFQDISPWTISVNIPFMLILGPLYLWTFSWCMYFGSLIYLRDASAVKARTRRVAQYAMTSFWCLIYWSFGVGIAFASYESTADFAEILILIALPATALLTLWVTYQAHVVNAPEPESLSKAKLAIGCLLGIALSIPAVMVILSVQLLLSGAVLISVLAATGQL